MPFAQIYMVEGRSDTQKSEVISKVSDAIAEATGSPLDTIRVFIQEIPGENWGKGGVPKKLPLVDAEST